VTTYKKSTFSSLVRLYQTIRPFDRDLLKILNEKDENVSSILDAGISFTDNVDCDLVTYTSNGTPNTEDTVGHSLGKVPTGIIPVSLDKPAVVYKSNTFSASNLFLKCNVASTTATLLIF